MKRNPAERDWVEISKLKTETTRRRGKYEPTTTNSTAISVHLLEGGGGGWVGWLGGGGGGGGGFFGGGEGPILQFYCLEKEA